MQTIYFYAPDNIRQKSLQEDQTQWNGFHSNFTAWIAQTYFYLKQAGYHCEIATKIPEKGIVIADRDTLDNDYPFLDQAMLICAKSDKEYHPSAHLHVVYNPSTYEKIKNSIWNPHLINHWPMPGLIPRSKERANLVENIAYIGTQGQLAPELKSEKWEKELSLLQCHWRPIWDKEQWNNYHLLDVVIAARSFDNKTYPNKGSIKLINAWHAGVPAIVTPETGFLAERKTDLDFIVVRSLEETIQAIARLKQSPELYLKMVENGRERAKEFTTQKILDQWIFFFNNIAFPAYEKWSMMSSSEKKWLFKKRTAVFKYYRAIDKVNRWMNLDRLIP